MKEVIGKKSGSSKDIKVGSTFFLGCSIVDFEISERNLEQINCSIHNIKFFFKGKVYDCISTI